MTQSIVELHIQSNIATLTLNRPNKCNAIDRHTCQLLIQHIGDINACDAIDMIVITGNHGFCSGADLRWFASLKLLTIEERIDELKPLVSLFQTLKSSEKLTVTKIEKFCIGGAMGIVACCDLNIADRQCRFELPEFKRGLGPHVIWPYISQAFSPQALRKLIYHPWPLQTNDMISLGIIDYTPMTSQTPSLNEYINNLSNKAKAINRFNKQCKVLNAPHLQNLAIAMDKLNISALE